LFLPGGSDAHADVEVKELERAALAEAGHRLSDRSAAARPSRSHAKALVGVGTHQRAASLPGPPHAAAPAAA
jgi:hypothetical protein